MKLYIINQPISNKTAQFLLDHLTEYNGHMCNIVEVKDSNVQNIKLGYLSKLTIGKLKHQLYNQWISNDIEIDIDDVIYYLIQTLQINCEDIIHDICSNNSYESLQVLLDRGVNVNIQNNDGDTPLHAACWNSVECVKLLLDQGINVNIPNNYGSTSLHCACINNSIETAKLLLDNGAKKNIQNIYGDTPLHYVCSLNRFECVKLLLDNSVKTDIVNRDGFTPLQLALKRNFTECIKLFQS